MTTDSCNATQTVQTLLIIVLTPMLNIILALCSMIIPCTLYSILIVYAVIAIVGLAFDQATKFLAKYVCT